MKVTKLAPMWKYTMVAYLTFWAIILVLGGMASMLFGAPPAVMNAITVLGSWSPTIVLLLMLKHLRPGTTIQAFYLRAFRDRPSVALLIAVPVIVFGLFLSAIGLLSILGKTPITTHLALPSALGLTILLTAFQGPSGAVFIVANVVVLTALTLIMAVFMRWCDNLLIAFWIHFCFNLSLRSYTGGVAFFAVFSVLYAVAALLMLGFLRKSKTTPSPLRAERLVR